MRLHSISALVVLCALAQACGDGPEPVADPRFQAIVDKATQKASSGGPPGAVLYVAGEHNAYAHAAGLADVEAGVNMRPGDRFRAGSILKTFVATVALQLTEEGRLSLDATLPTLVDKAIALRFADSDRITVRTLLNHTSGIPEMLSEPVLAEIAAHPKRIWTEQEWLDLAAAQPPAFAPGQGWGYSNTDYVLIGLIIERATGQSWRAEVRRRVIDRLHLPNTTLPEPGDPSIAGSHAHGYLATEGGLVDITEVDPSMAGACGGSALVTTTSDLVHFLDALLDGELFREARTLDKMLTFVPAGEEGGLLYFYGLGIEKHVMADGVELIGHGGSTAGYAATMARVSMRNATVAAAVNVMDLGTVYLDIVAPVVAQLEPEH